MIDNKNVTTPVPPVGADGGQPLAETNIKSIAGAPAEINDFGEISEEMCRQRQRMNDPAYLHTVSMNELYENVYQSRPPIIDGLLHPGTYLFVGAPKVVSPF